MRRNFLGILHFKRSYSNSFSRVAVKIDDEVRQSLEANIMKPRHHPGILKVPTCELPPNVKNAMEKIIGDTTLKQLLNESGVLMRFLHSRQLPVEEEDFYRKKSEIKHEVKEMLGVKEENLSEEEISHFKKIVDNKTDETLKKRVYNWVPMEYTRHKGLVYMVARAAPQYAVTRKVFKEIMRYDPDFSPNTIFDFGSGIGTVIWAANDVWKNSKNELFCVDSSAAMNDISRSIIEIVDSKMINNIFYRQFLPSSFDTNYDLVVSSYSFMELPSMRTRLQTILNLWNKTKKYLVIIEYGTMAGFKVISEAREFLLHLANNKIDEKELHVMAPCPHDTGCPRIKADRTPCNFQSSFYSFPQKKIVQKELYSYVIFKKGERNESSPNWPRIVRPVLNRSRHSICRLCTSEGNLQEIIFSPAKHGKVLYRCAKASDWGDVLPINLEDSQQNEEQ